MLEQISPKQLELLKAVNSIDQYNFVAAEGSIRSGKTYIGIMAFIVRATNLFDKKAFIVGGQTLGAVKRNIVPYIEEWCKTLNISFAARQQNTVLYVGSNIFYVFGADDVASRKKVQGLTAAGAFIDEAALCHKEFIMSCIGRCSVDDSMIVFTLNPESEYHWFNLEFIQEKEAKKLAYVQLLLDDNPSLSKQIKDRYEASFTGVFHKRFILGLWSAATGAIWPEFKLHDNKDLPDEDFTYFLAIDYGTSTTFVALLIKCYKDVDYIVDEFRWDAAKKKVQLSDEQYAAKLQEWLGDKKISAVYCDPSAASFKVVLRQMQYPLLVVSNDVLNGIRTSDTVLKMGKVSISKDLPILIAECENYVWDEKKQERGEDAPRKIQDHGCDAIRYYCYNKYRYLDFNTSQGLPNKPTGF